MWGRRFGRMHRKRSPRIEYDGVPDRARLAGHDAADDLGVVGRVLTAQGLGRAATEPVVVRIDNELGDLAAGDGPYVRRRRGGQLVEAVVATKHPGVDT